MNVATFFAPQAVKPVFRASYNRRKSELTPDSITFSRVSVSAELEVRHTSSDSCIEMRLPLAKAGSTS